jgi:hypothetical protein
VGFLYLIAVLNKSTGRISDNTIQNQLFTSYSDIMSETERRNHKIEKITAIIRNNLAPIFSDLLSIFFHPKVRLLLKNIAFFKN